MQNADLENRKMGNTVLNCYDKQVHKQVHLLAQKDDGAGFFDISGW